MDDVGFSGGDPPSPPQAPEGSRWRRAFGRFYVTGVFWYKFHFWGVTHLPQWGIFLFVTLFTTFFYFALLNIRRAIASNLEQILGPCGFLTRELRIYRTFWNFAWCLTERYEQFRPGRSFDTDIEGSEHWESLAESGRGFIFVTSHLGNWEMGSTLPATRHQKTVHLVREQEMDPSAQEFIEGLLARFSQSNYVTHFAGDLELALKLFEALGRGEIVALQADRPRVDGRTRPANLFGKTLDFPVGPYALARLADVDLLPVFILRKGRRKYQVVVREPVRVPRTEDRNADFGESLEKVACEVEAAIRRAPYQFFCFRTLWPDA